MAIGWSPHGSPSPHGVSIAPRSSLLAGTARAPTHDICFVRPGRSRSWHSTDNYSDLIVFLSPVGDARRSPLAVDDRLAHPRETTHFT